MAARPGPRPLGEIARDLGPSASALTTLAYRGEASREPVSTPHGVVAEEAQAVAAELGLPRQASPCPQACSPRSVMRVDLARLTIQSSISRGTSVNSCLRRGSRGPGRAIAR